MLNQIGSKILLSGFSILFIGSVDVATAQESNGMQTYSSEECEEMCESTTNPCYSSCMNPKQTQAPTQVPVPVPAPTQVPAQVKPQEQVNRPLIISPEPQAVPR